jgi:hypothetical protein
LSISGPPLSSIPYPTLRNIGKGGRLKKHINIDWATTFLLKMNSSKARISCCLSKSRGRSPTTFIPSSLDKFVVVVYCINPTFLITCDYCTDSSSWTEGARCFECSFRRKEILVSDGTPLKESWKVPTFAPYRSIFSPPFNQIKRWVLVVNPPIPWHSCSTAKRRSGKGDRKGCICLGPSVI